MALTVFILLHFNSLLKKLTENVS